jgi:multiple sugar transport system permease protein
MLVGTRLPALARPREELVGRFAWRLALYVVLAAGAVLFATPFVWMLSTSVKAPGEVFIYPPQWIPRHFLWGNYLRPWTEVPFVVFYENSIAIAVIDILATVASSSIVAFAFARMRFHFRDPLFMIVLSTIMLPHQVTLIPQFVLFATFHWVDTLRPLIVPTFFANPFGIFLIRQFMMGIPHELDDAARIDGAGWFEVFSQIVLPLCTPALGVVAIDEFIYRWNDFLDPLIYLNTPEHFTIQLGLEMLTTEYTSDVPGTIAMTTLSILPVLCIFFLAQRYFIQGVVINGLKG